VQVVHLDSGVDLEQQLRQLNLRGRRKWSTSIKRKQWWLIGIIMGGMAVCLVVMVALYLLLPGMVT